MSILRIRGSKKTHFNSLVYGTVAKRLGSRLQLCEHRFESYQYLQQVKSTAFLVGLGGIVWKAFPLPANCLPKLSCGKGSRSVYKYALHNVEVVYVIDIPI